LGSLETTATMDEKVTKEEKIRERIEDITRKRII